MNSGLYELGHRLIVKFWASIKTEDIDNDTKRLFTKNIPLIRVELKLY